MKSYSQYGQDIILKKIILKKSKKGLFIDIGANDGITFSNSYLFEKHYGWMGVCFEPQKVMQSKLHETRSCMIRDVAIADRIGTAEFNSVQGPDMLSGISQFQNKYEIDKINDYNGDVIKYIVNVSTLSQEISNSPFKGLIIDFVSIDVEGAELQVLQGIDNSLYSLIKSVVVENNYQTFKRAI